MARETRDGKIVVTGDEGEHIRIEANQDSGGGVTLTVTDDSGNAVLYKSYSPEEAENLTVRHGETGSLDCESEVSYNIIFENYRQEDDYFTVITDEDGQVTIEDHVHTMGDDLPADRYAGSQDLEDEARSD